MDCPSLVTSELYYRSSCKKYPELMPHLLEPTIYELVLNPEGLFCVDKTLVYESAALKTQLLFLVNEILRIHNIDFAPPKNFSATTQHSLFLKKKSSGLLRLDNAQQMGFYKEGVLDLGITGDKRGLLYVYTPDSQIHVSYIEFCYYLGTFN